MSLQIDIDTTAVNAELAAIQERSENLRPAWQAAENEMRDAFNALFFSGGHGAWTHTLIDTGRLRRSFVQPNGDNIDRRTETTWTFGSAVPYAHYYEALLIDVFIERSPVDAILKKSLEALGELRG